MTRLRSRPVWVLLGLLLFVFGLVTVTPAQAQNPFAIDGNVPDAGTIPFSDPFGADAELGPVNSNGTKLGVIHTAPLPMLDFTNPNGQVDLVNIWLQTAVAGNGDIWLYFAWQRDSNKGSGVVSYEFQQAPLALGCDYTDPEIDQVLPESQAESDLIAVCNPWSGRQADDFLIVWDQQGQTVNIILRTFDGVAFDAGVTLDATVSEAMLSGDKFFGEAAVNLSETVFPPEPTECLSIGNIVPGTITGNSDTADYKDTVLAPFADFITITNCGIVTIRKQTEPDGLAGDFGFTPVLDTEDPDPGTFTLTDDGVKTFANVFAGGPYTVTEDNLPPGFELIDIDCSASSDPSLILGEDVTTATATFNVAIGETVDCTFTNQALGNIIIEKMTDPAGDPQAFTFTPSYGGDFSLSDGQSHDSGDLEPGTYSVSETVPAGWELTSATCDDGSDPSAIDLQAGETVTCTFTNQKDANIIIEKVTDPAGDPQEFVFTPSYGAGFSLSDGQSHDSGDLEPGTYSVSETVPAGWELTSVTCDDGSDPGSIGLVAGETVTCTFTNQKDAFIIIEKVTAPTGSTQVFAFTPSYGAGFSLSDGQSNNSGDLDPGTYTVSETVPVGWKLESATCDDGSDPSAIDLQAGETVTCTFTNSTGAILIDKTTKHATLGSPQPLAGVTFVVKDSGDNVIATVVTDDQGKACIAGLVVGDSYTVIETDAPTGYDSSAVAPQSLAATAAECGPPLNGTAALAAFVNDPLSKIVITFESLAGAGVTKTTSVTCTGPSADGSEQGPLEHTQSATFTNLKEGTYNCTILIDP